MEARPALVYQSTSFGGRREVYMSQPLNKVVLGQEDTEQVEGFSEDGDLVLSDETNVAVSARNLDATNVDDAKPTIVLTPVFQKMSKNQIDRGFA